MARRDMMKTAAKVNGGIPTEYDMTAEEMNLLHDISADDLFDALSIAFHYGYVMGGRAAKAGKYKETTGKAWNRYDS